VPSAEPKPRHSLFEWCNEDLENRGYLLDQWHPKKNGDLTPSDISRAGKRPVWWLCPVADDHEWEAHANSRVSGGQGCPCCAGKKVSKTNSLAVLYPEVAVQWHPTKNGDLKPEDFTAGSNKKFWWQCPLAKDHEWQTTVDQRTRGGNGCPYCTGKRPSSTNSLALLFPEVAAQWHPTRNGSLTPKDVVAGSSTKLWWKCEVAEDHEWQTTATARTFGSRGCPFCAGQKWSLSNNLAELFPKVASEWHPTRNGDLRSQDLVAGSGKRVWWKCPVADDHEWEGSVISRTGGKPEKERSKGCPFCSGNRLSTTNSVQGLFPEVAAQWHPTKNGDLTPSDVVAGTHKRLWWKCDIAEDHEWQAVAKERTFAGRGCPFCDGKRVSTSNSLASVAPDLAAQWHPTKNGDLKPDEVVAGSAKKAWWKCDVADDHEWRVTPGSRIGYETGCPACSGNQLSVTNSLATLFPRIAAQWHPTKNGDLTPSDVVAGTNKKLWWKCPAVEGHEWPAVTSSRTSRGLGCPDCTLTPRSAQELELAHELAALINFDLDAHKIRSAGRSHDVDIIIEDLKVVVEFDGNYWHRNKADKDLQKTHKLEDEGWNVIRVRERPLDSIHVNDVMVEAQAPAKTVADLVLNKIVEVTGTKIPRLDEYLAFEGPWREAEALKAIRAYQAERAAKKAARKERNAHRKDGSATKAV